MFLFENKLLLCILHFYLIKSTNCLRVDGVTAHLEGEATFLSYDGLNSIYILGASALDYLHFDHIWIYSLETTKFTQLMKFDRIKVVAAAADVNGDMYYFASATAAENSTILYKFDVAGREIHPVKEFSHISVLSGFSALIRLDSLYFLDSGYNGTDLLKFSLDLKTLQRFQLPETLDGIKLSFCGYHVCIFGGTQMFKFDIFRHTFQVWKWEVPSVIVSNAFEVGDSVLMFNQDYNLRIVDTERQKVEVEKMDFVDEVKNWQALSAIWAQETKQLLIFASGLKNRRSTVFAVSLYIKYTETPKGIGAINATSVKIPCGITGAPKPAATWLKDGKVLAPAQLDAELNLIIPKVDASFEGKYVCVAASFLGHLAREILLNVKRPTLIHNWNVTLNGIVGRSILIPCNATSDNLTMYNNWLQNGTEIDWSPAPRYQKVMENHGLLILDAVAADSGNYTCVVWTKIDRDNATVALSVEDNSEPDLILINTHEDKDSNLFLVTILPTVAFLGLGLLISTFCYCKYRNAFRLQESELKGFLLGEPTLDNTDLLEEFTDSKPYDQSFELEANSFQLHQETILGFGEFGVVYKGVVMKNGKEMAVAFKTCKSAGKDMNQQRRQLKCLLSELKVMIHIGNHPNIIHLVGAYTGKLREGVAYVAVDFCVNGNLESLLRRSTFVKNIQQYSNTFEEGRSCVTSSVFSAWALQISNGMEFLGFKKIIHSDLATRNVLVSSDMSIRITDFGLSRRLENYGNYVKMGGEPLPRRWMAVESLDMRSFSAQSDVWSFGVTVWEIYSMGSIPYPGQSWTADFVQELKKGVRLPPPEYAVNEIYEKMKECWDFNPNQRPTFTQLVQFFQNINYKDANIVYLS